MKNKIFFRALSVCFLFGACQSDPNTLTVKGAITGFDEGTILVLLADGEDQFIPVDSAILSPNGKFILKSPAQETGKYFLFVGDPEVGSTYFKEFFGAPGYTVTITGDHTAPQALKVRSDIPEQAEWNRFEDAVRHLKYETGKLSFRINELNAQTPSDEQQKKVSRYEVDSLQKKADVFQYEIAEIILGVIAENPHTEKALEELAKLAWDLKFDSHLEPLRDRMEQAYRLLSTEEQESPSGKEIKEILFLPSAVEGQPMVDTELAGLDGNRHKLSEFAGKYILLDFWASWCGPCLAALPEIKAFAEKNGDVAVVIGINLDKKRSDWAEASEKYGITWINLHGQPEPALARQYGVSGIPHITLISPDGIVLQNNWHYSPGTLGKEFEKYLKQ